MFLRCLRTIPAILFLIGLAGASVAQADVDSDAEFLADATVTDITIATMRDVVIPMTEASLRIPKDCKVMTARAQAEFVAIYNEQFDYLVRNDLRAISKEVFQKILYT